MRTLAFPVFGLLVMLLQPSCSLSKKKPQAAEEAPQTVVVGIVEMVSPEQNYVLIRCERSPELPAGAELVALDATGAQAKLKLTPERKGNYLTADITQGQPRVMNLVLFKRTDLSQPGAPVVPPGKPPAAPFTPEMPMPLLPISGLPEGGAALPAGGGAVSGAQGGLSPAPRPAAPPSELPPSVGGGTFSPIDLEPPVQ